MKLIERQGELDALTEAFTDCADGRGLVVVVSGPPATGKTALLDAFSEDVMDSGALFLGATASRAERDQTLGVMSQLFQGIDQSIVLPERATRLLQRDPRVETDGETTFHVLRDLCDALLGFAERGQVVIGVDDVHYADPASLECLLYLARRMRSSRMLIVLNETSRLRQQYPQFRVELFRQAHCRHIRLGLLSPDGVSDLLAGPLGRDMAERLAPGGHRMSGGNPLLVHALLEDHSSSTGPLAGELVPGDAFRQAVSSCLYRCDRDVLSVAKALVVLGEHVPLFLVGELLDLDIESVGQSVSALTTVGLLDAGRFRHEAARLAVLDTMLAAERAAMHGCAAGLRHDHGAPATIVAQHLIATDGIEAPWVIPTLEEAAEQELKRGEIGRATDCLRRAHELSADDLQRAAIKAALAHAEWRADPFAAARHLPELSEHARAGRLRWPDVAAVNGYLLWHGQVEEAVDLLDAVEERTGPADAETIIGIDTARFWVRCAFPEQLDEAHPDWIDLRRDHVPVRTLRQLQVAEVLSGMLSGGLNDDALTAAEQFLQEVLRDGPSIASILPAIAALIYSNKLREAEFWCDALLRNGTAQNAPINRALVGGIRSMVEVRQGRMAAAERSAHRALALISPQSWGVVLGLPLNSMLLATTAMGRYEEAARYLTMPVPEEMLRTTLGAHYMHARGRYYLATDRAQAALGEFQMCGDLMVKWGLDLPTLVPWRIDAAKALLAMGRQRQARDLAQEQLSRLEPDHAHAAGAALAILAATGDLEERPALLREAVRTLEISGDRYELSRVVAELSRTSRALGDEEEARAQFARAVELAEECGVPAPIPGAACDAPEDEPIAPANGLSEAERRVAELAARGHTNRQIANRLFITVSTVEQHLTRVYRKLKVNRRTDLSVSLEAGAERYDACGYP
jgi:DNA-binding CsgD family transcriptional regulator